MIQTLWLLLRALLAVGLMIGFYVLALTVIGILLWIPYAEVAYLHYFSIKLSLACLVGASTLFFAILPRRDVFAPPGPAIVEQDEPRLFAFIRQVSGEMKQKMPAEVFIVGDANAWVAHRGGIMGFGSRRVMGLGLPLMQALPVAELRAVLAHEFGHLAGGDVVLGPWIHKTYGAIRRTLADVGGFVVFKWYATVFLRITHAVSRRQELVADRLAARVSGPGVLASALRRTHALGPAYQVYFQNDVAPVVRAGFLPPVLQGFDQFLRTVLTRRIATDVCKAAENQSADVYDSHPSLSERVAALGCTNDSAPAADVTDPSSALLDRAEHYSTQLLERAIGEERLRALHPIAWEAVAQSIYVKRWQATAAACAPVLAPFTFETLPSQGKALDTLAKSWNVQVPVHARAALILSGMQSAFATRLVADGWAPVVRPGEPPAFIKNTQRCHPFALVAGRVSGSINQETWLAQCTALNVSGPLVDSQWVPAQPPAEDVPAPVSERARRRRRAW